eukprot:COSAG02_NODE_2562_length_8527_cov_24.422995_3_plen_92_part_00
MYSRVVRPSCLSTAVMAVVAAVVTLKSDPFECCAVALLGASSSTPRRRCCRRMRATSRFLSLGGAAARSVYTARMDLSTCIFSYASINHVV